MAVSGRKSENSIRSYAARTSLSKKRKMCEALSFSTSENKIKSYSQSFSIGESSKSLATISSPEERLLTLTDSQERFLNEIKFQQMSNQQQTVNNYNDCTFNFNTKCQYCSVILHIHMPVLYFTLSVKYVNLKTEYILILKKIKEFSIFRSLFLYLCVQ